MRFHWFSEEGPHLRADSLHIQVYNQRPPNSNQSSARSNTDLVHWKKEVGQKCLPLFLVSGFCFILASLHLFVCLAQHPLPAGLLAPLPPLVSLHYTHLPFASRALDVGFNRCMATNSTYTTSDIRRRACLASHQAWLSRRFWKGR